MAKELKVEIRQSRGKREARRLRQAGQVPAVLYGHKQDSISLSVPGPALNALIQRGTRLIDMTGGVNEAAFVREVQWNTWGTAVLHVDFTRISADEVIDLQLTVELRGEAPGVREGGVVKQMVHEIELKCPAMAIPDRISISINALKLGDALTLGDLELPEGAVVVGDPTTVVVHCIEPVDVDTEEVGEAGPNEPEVIGAKDQESEKK